MKVTVEVRQNKLKTVKGRMPAAAQLGVDETLSEIQLFAKVFAAVDTGEMRSKIVKNKFSVVARALHSSYNEFGTYKMAAQPFMRPAMSRAAPGVPRYFKGFGASLL